MRPNPLRAPGPPRWLEADGARVKGGRRARRPRCRARGRAAPGDARGCPAARAGVAPLYFLWAGAASVSAGSGCKRQARATVVSIPGASEPAGAASFAEKGGGASDRLPRSRGSPLAGARGEPPSPPHPPPGILRRRAPLPGQGLRSERGRGLKGVRRGLAGGGGGRRRSDPLGLARLALRHLFHSILLSPSLPLVSPTLGRIYRSQ